jgi:hypothetical protein
MLQARAVDRGLVLARRCDHRPEFLLWSGQYGGMDIDAVGIHPYTPGIHPTFNANNRETHVLADVSAAREVLAWLGGSSTPLWITEVGADADCNNNGDPPPCADSEFISYPSCLTGAEKQRQATDLTNIWLTIKSMCSQNNVTLAVFWDLKDPNTWVRGSNWYAGFLGPNYDATKPAYTWFSGSHVLAGTTCTG